MWSSRADELLLQTSSTEPTPGSGAAAAVAGAFGIALALKALTITDGDGCASLRSRGEALVERVVAAADRDAEAFAALIAARGSDADLEAATVAAADVPLELAGALLEAIALAEEAEPLVKRELVSDALASGDLLRGAGRAALRAAALNVASLEEQGAADAARFRQRLDALRAQLDA